jgi:hypothetical protein
MSIYKQYLTKVNCLVKKKCSFEYFERFVFILISQNTMHFQIIKKKNNYYVSWTNHGKHGKSRRLLFKLHNEEM